MKRCDELRDLSDDHHNVLVAALRAKRTGAGETELAVSDVWALVAELYELSMAPHFRIEEEVLLPALERAGEHGLVERTLSEHRAIRAALAEERERDAVALAALGRLLEQHVRFEERVLFERAQSALAPADLQRVAHASRSLSRTCPTSLA